MGNRISIKKNQRNETNQNEVQNELFPDDTYNPKNRLVEQNLKNQFSMTVKEPDARIELLAIFRIRVRRKIIFSEQFQIELLRIRTIEISNLYICIF